MTPGRVWGVRAAAIAATAGLVATATALLDQALSPGGQAALERAFLIAFVLGFAWLAWCFVVAAIGLVSMIADHARGVRPRFACERSNVRTALLFPIYNEDVTRVSANIAAMRDALAAQDVPERFAIFVLSDSTDGDVRIEERRAVAQLMATGNGAIPVNYRHRDENIGKKAGNIAEFVQRWGAAFAYMIVLDADSLMRAETIVEMARRMQARPDLGLLQTAPILIGRRALFGRYLQFASAAFAPSFARGLALVGGQDGAYWGHNAIIRTRAFARCCGMAPLTGAPPFGGPVLSHDFVEAALLRAGGWKVEIAPDLGGSYEEAPSDLLAYAARDRRWAQGNLQHLRVMFAPGLSFWGRVSLFQGALAYLASPFWLAFLLTGLAVALHDALTPSTYFPDERVLFPVWDVSMGVAGVLLLGLVTMMLLAHRLACIVTLSMRPMRRARFGGAGPLAASFLMEVLVSTLLAPIMMMLQTRAVGEVLIGRDSGWPASPRADGAITLEDAATRTWWISLAGLLIATAAATAGLATFFWFAPVTVSLIGAPVWVWLSSRADLGVAAGHARIFITPSESAPELVIAASRRKALVRGVGSDAVTA
ncbi:MAG: glucans biosynthesis glucosyltransferase MdoH [Caulobacterales bacterium]|nr:glucans biosynthesis glucosyltransferase MdoH [Caulobacterales bacterium]